MIMMSCPRCGSKFEVDANLPSTNCPSCAAKVIAKTDDRDDLSVDMELGRACLLEKNIKEAYNHFSRAAKKNPSSGDAWFWIGVALVLRENFTEGDIYWKKSTFSIQETVSQLKEVADAIGIDTLLQLSKSAANKGSMQWAEMFADAAFHVDKTKTFEHYLVMAGIACRINECDKAQLYLEHAQKSVPRGHYYNRQLVREYMILAQQCGTIGDFDKAASYLEYALQIEPGMTKEIVGTEDSEYSSMGYIALANQAAAKKQFDLAASYLERALQIVHPRAKEIIGDRGHGYIELAHQAGIAGQFDKAMSYLERALQIGFKNQIIGHHHDLDHHLVDTKGYIGLAYIAGRMGQFDKATSCLERALEISPNHNLDIANGYILLAKNVLSREKSEDTISYTKVASCLERAIEIYPDISALVAYPYLDLAKAVAKKGLLDLAKSYLQCVVKYGDRSSRRYAKETAKEFGIKFGWF